MDITKTVDQIIQQYLLPEHALDPVIVKFIYAYLDTRHVGDASKTAGIKLASGNKLMSKTDIQNALREINKTLARAHNFNAAEILERANEVAQFNPAEVFNDDGTVKYFKDIPPALTRVIKRMKVEEVWTADPNGIKSQTGRIVSIEFWDKLKAVELLGKFEGLFSDTTKHLIGVDSSLANVLLQQSEQRALENAKRVELPRLNTRIPDVVDIEEKV
jgi:hypothetical protein